MESHPKAGAGAAPEVINWAERSMPEIVAHLVEARHDYTRRALDRIDALFRRPCEIHGGDHAELDAIRLAFVALRDELRPHLKLEEDALFPYIVELHRCRERGASPPTPPFHTVANPIWLMNTEHEGAISLFGTIREVTGGYHLAPGACAIVREAYEALEALESDFAIHTHIESKILFPRAKALEASGG